MDTGVHQKGDVCVGTRETHRLNEENVPAVSVTKFGWV